MAWNRGTQRGEGKIGCIISLVVFVILLAAAFKIVPYWWAVDQLVSTADELASRAGTLTPATLNAQMKAKAGELELGEAQAPGAISVNISGSSGSSGNCTISLRFSRDIDMYGITKITWNTNKSVSKPWARY